MIEKYIHALKEYALSHETNYGDGESILTLLYEAYNDCNRLDDTHIKANFEELYRLMNGMPLKEMERSSTPSVLCAEVMRRSDSLRE